VSGTAQRHRIRRQVLEVHAPDEDSARRIQSELGRIQRQHLESIIEQCCSELSASDRIHRIDLLEIDLGTVDIGHLERELPGKLKSVMRKALARQIEKQDSEARRRDSDPAVTSYLELIAIFATTGVLPWWADSSNPHLIPEALDAVLERAPDRLADLLRTIVRDLSQLVRIVLHSNDKTLSRLLRVLVSASPSSGIVLQQQAEAIVSTWSSMSGANITWIRNAYWLALIGRAAAGAASPASFWQAVFGEIESQSHEAYVSLMTGILMAAHSSRESVSTFLTPVLRAVIADRQGRVFIKLPSDIKAELIELLGDEPGVRTGMEDGVVRSTGKRQPSASEIDGSLETTPHEPTLKKLRTSRHDSPLDLTFGDADTVYIENSGLVILWPFLPRFFERLQLVEGSEFQSAAAQHRAVGLLQYLVAENPSPPEYQATLNKILCGLNPEKVLQFGEPVTDVESEECDTLLSSVIAQAPILRDLSLDVFRGSFLLRKGLLSARDGVWLLRVERETYDVVLDRFPWSFDWVRLPWMEVPLGVEW